MFYPYTRGFDWNEQRLILPNDLLTTYRHTRIGNNNPGKTPPALVFIDGIFPLSSGGGRETLSNKDSINQLINPSQPHPDLQLRAGTARYITPTTIGMLQPPGKPRGCGRHRMFPTPGDDIWGMADGGGTTSDRSGGNTVIPTPGAYLTLSAWCS